ncbi:MAG: hypothetical protein IAE99_13060, partial [Rhodothermales bacterium]|nr:hypothetical protein [Rhodothermales bacterium]
MNRITWNLLQLLLGLALVPAAVAQQAAPSIQCYRVSGTDGTGYHYVVRCSIPALQNLVRVQFSQSADFSAPYYDQVVLAQGTTSYAMRAGVNFYRVAYAYHTPLNWTAAQSLTIPLYGAPDYPQRVQITNPELGQNVTAQPVELRWQPLADPFTSACVAYDYTVAQGGTTVLSGRTTQQAVILPVLPSGGWAVQASCVTALGTVGSYFNDGLGFQVNAPLRAPALASPADGTSLLSDGTSLAVDPVSGVIGYRFLVRRAADGVVVLDTFSTSSSITRTFDPGTTFSWTASGRYAPYGLNTVDAPSGQTWSFSTGGTPPAVPAAPSQVSPAPGEVLATNAAVFRWNSTAHATSYRLLVQRFDNGATALDTITGDTTITATLAASTIFRWTVQAFNVPI